MTTQTTVTKANSTNLLQSAQAIASLAQVAGLSLHVVENFQDSGRIWDIYGRGKFGRGGVNEKFYQSFNTISGSTGVGAYLVKAAYAKLNESATRTGNTIKRLNGHTIVTGGNAAKINEQLTILALYAGLFGVDLDGQNIDQQVS